MSHPFRDLVAREAAVVFDQLAADALYQAVGGSPVAVKAMPTMADVVALQDVFARVQQTARSFNLQTAQVPARPNKGDTITTLDDAGEPFEVFTLVEGASVKDRLRIEWICIVGEPTAAEPPPEDDFHHSLDFSDARNSMYAGGY